MSTSVWVVAPFVEKKMEEEVNESIGIFGRVEEVV